MPGFLAVRAFGSSRHYPVPAKFTGSGAGRHGWPAVIHGCKLLTVAACGVLVPHLIVSGAHVMLAFGPHFFAGRAGVHAAIATVEAHAIESSCCY